MMRIYCFI